MHDRLSGACAITFVRQWMYYRTHMHAMLKHFYKSSIMLGWQKKGYHTVKQVDHTMPCKSVLEVIILDVVTPEAKFAIKWVHEKKSVFILLQLATSLGLSCPPSRMLDCSAARALAVDPHTEDPLYCRSITKGYKNESSSCDLQSI